MTANAGETQAQLVEDNISSLIKAIIPLGGDTIDTTNMQTMDLATYIARSAVQEFVKHVTIPGGRLSARDRGDRHEGIHRHNRPRKV